MKKTKLKKKSKVKTSTLRNKCDSFLTPIVKKKSPYCEGCGKETQVAHHWIEKSRSLNLRFDLRNLIALCNSCHAKIHNRFGNSVVGALDVAETIIKKRGKKWKEEMDRDGRVTVKGDIIFYTKHLERLTKLNEIS